MAQFSLKPTSRYRWKELGLLILPFLLLLLATIQLLVIHANADLHATLKTNNLPTIYGLIPIFGLIGLLLVANITLSIFFPKSDQVLLPLVGLLSGIGIVMATRLGPDLVSTQAPEGIPELGSRQLTWVLAGLVLCLATVFLLRNINLLFRYKYTWIFVSLLVLLPTIISGIISFKTNAPTRDVLGFGPFKLQPSELFKIIIIVFFAGYLGENREMISQGYLRIGFLRLPPLRQLGPLLMMLGLSLIIFLVVRDLGLALLIYSLFLCMVYLTSGKLTYVIASLAIFALLAMAGYSVLGYVRERFAILSIDMVNWSATSDEQYQNVVGAGQIVQGLIALSSGGIFGSGLGLGHPAGPGFVPIVESDMILTGLGEELGLAGIFAIIGLYLLIIYRGYRIAIESPDPMSKLLAAGLTSIFAIQTLIISAGNLKFMPLTGITLPFLSYGGSSILVNYIIIGILLRISHNTAVEREGTS
ncbi:MAG: FtsW/RodA/SpoVE family cell cycle protein [Ktedonobacteraceae bacterium]|nr:FtsW/RodA/SpoVE family cell cycle protein [Ktedonobacteraceae bacterium]